MTDFNGTVAIAIEGIGFGASYSKGAAFYNGETPPDGAGNYEWVNALIERPSGLETLTEPVLGRTTVGAFTFRLRRSDDIAKALLYQQSISRLSLASDLSKTGTSMSVANASGSNPASSSVVWIEDEAIFIDTNAGGGSMTGLTRGYWGTQRKAHESSRFVHTKQNYIRFRGVKLLVLDPSGNVVSWWQGFLNRVRTANAGTQIVLECLEGFSSTQKMKVNRGAPNLIIGNQQAVRLNTGAADGNGDYRFVEIAGEIDVREHNKDRYSLWATRVFKLGEADNKPTAVQVGDALTVAVVDQPFAQLEFQSFPAFMGSKFDADEDERREFMDGGLARSGLRITKPMYEVAVISKNMDRWLERNTALGPVSFTRDLDHPYHPLSAVAALWFSDDSLTNDLLQYDVLNGRFWGGDLIHYATNSILNDIPALIEETRELEIDQLILGWGGKPVGIWQLGLEILRAWGFFVVFDENGEFTIDRLKLIDVNEYDTALSNKVKVRSTPDGTPFIEWESAFDETYSSIIAKVGKTPFHDELEVEVNVDGVSKRASRLGDGDAVSFDYQTVARERWASLREILENTAILLYSAMPRLTVWVEGPDIEGLDYQMGAVVTLDELPLYRGGQALAWLIDSEGELTTQQDGIQFAGRIVGRQFELSSRTYRLRLLLTNHKFGAFSRWRAPAMEITGWTNNGDGTFDLECAADSLYGYADSDAEAFYVGDVIEIRDITGARVGTSGIVGEWGVSAVAAQALTTNTGPTSDPTGYFVLLAPWDPASGGYFNDTIFTNIGRAWSAWANTDEPPTIGVSADEADVYG